MKKQLLLLLTTIISLHCYSQISFEKGYYIDNDLQKISCLIKNNDWKNNPTEFEYKLSENSESKKADIKLIKEFGVNNISKYIRANVKIDISSNLIAQLSNEKKPLFKQKTVFLKVLVEGKSNLYEYVEGNLRKYFYRKEDLKIEQLIFKKYRTKESNIGENNRFRQQLWANLKCSSIKMSKIKNVYYTKNDLVKFFTEYSKCNNDNVINFEPQEKRDLFNLTIRPRLNNSSLELHNSLSTSRDTKLDSKTGFGFGLELEYILPFNKNKWTVAIEPTYQSYKAQKTTNVTTVSGGKLITDVNYKSIEIPVSFRHYLFLNNNSKLFINVTHVFGLSSNSSIDFKRADNSNLESLAIQNTRKSLAFGLGYKLKDKYVIEMRYLMSRELLSNHSYWESDYKTFSLIFGYSFF